MVDYYRIGHHLNLHVRVKLVLMSVYFSLKGGQKITFLSDFV